MTHTTFNLFLVLIKRLELLRLSALAPKTSVSAIPPHQHSLLLCEFLQGVVTEQNRQTARRFNRWDYAELLYTIQLYCPDFWTAFYTWTCHFLLRRLPYCIGVLLRQMLKRCFYSLANNHLSTVVIIYLIHRPLFQAINILYSFLDAFYTQFLLNNCAAKPYTRHTTCRHLTMPDLAGRNSLDDGCF